MSDLFKRVDGEIYFTVGWLYEALDIPSVFCKLIGQRRGVWIAYASRRVFNMGFSG